MWVESAVGLDLLEALLRERVPEGAVRKGHALLELRLLVLRGCVERPLEVVEDRQQLLDQPLRRMLGPLALQAGFALAVVVELRLEPLQPVEVLVALARRLSELVELLDLLRLLLCAFLGRHLPSSTTS